MRRSIVVAALACCVAAAASAAEEPPIATDRPGFANSPVVVPAGAVQVEAGGTWLDVAAGDADAANGPEALVRWGILPRFELRLALPDRLEVEGSAVDDGAWTDAVVGMKWQIGPLGDRVDLALVAGLQVPTGTVDGTADTVDPRVDLTAGFALDDRWSVGGQVSVLRETLETARGDDEIWIYGATAGLGVSVGERAAAFLEARVDDGDDLDTVVLVQHGWTWRLAPRLQVDARVAVGLTDVSPDWLAGAGIAKRW